ncbi:myb/SANT-like DNA-binding domain-containing protein 3 [Anoplophora glabripennis]|uniref:myb/SANT-like DNA-binding domain-containing protein 3 n=1 Tax=Anoplophora glabripennis TaxID=217634 RepID=UPI0008738461|nr:myb/SANT-like DNA-binding domain-containing protein 3 [Anoplophora glabripennis]
MEKEKDKRSPNFTKLETEILVDLALKYKHVIENKRTDATTWKDKNDTWQIITDEFNAISGNFPRSVKSVRSKYETFKKDLRKTCAKVKEEIKKTGGGAITCPILKPHEEKFLSVSDLTMLGLSSRFDNDIDPDHFPQEEPGGFLREESHKLNESASENAISITNININETDIINEDDTEEIHIEYVHETDPPPKGRAEDKENYMSQSNASGVNKFLHKNKKSKGTIQRKNTKVCIEMVETKKKILELQETLLEQEIIQKSAINELIIENLKRDLEIKNIKLQNFRDEFQF